jgi:hypothetical protein
MLMLLCVQSVQTNNNEFHWREEFFKFFIMHMNKRYVNLVRKQKEIDWKKSNWQDTQVNS